MKKKTDMREFIQFKRRTTLHYLETQNPTLYEVYDKKGKHICGIFSEESMNDYKKKGYTIKIGDIEKMKEGFRKGIEEHENSKKEKK